MTEKERIVELHQRAVRRSTIADRLADWLHKNPDAIAIAITRHDALEIIDGMASK